MMTRDAKSSQTPGPGKDNSYKQFAAVAAAAGEAAALEGEVRAWLRMQRKARDFSPANVLAMIQWRSKAFRAEVVRQLSPAARAKTVQGIFAEHERGLLQKLKDAGFQPIAIPNRAEHMRTAIAELVRHIDAGNKPSAATAAKRPGLDHRQVSKLARVSVEREAVNAGICLVPSSPFVAQLRQSPHALALIEAPHVNLATLARTMSSVHKLLATAPRAPTAGRGAWHALAVELWTVGRTANQIANLTGQKLGTVKAHLRRRGLRRAADSSGTAGEA